MIYDHSLILNTSRGELDVLAQDPLLEGTDQFILSLRSYMDNQTLLNRILDLTGYTKVEPLCISASGDPSCLVESNLYLVSR